MAQATHRMFGRFKLVPIDIGADDPNQLEFDIGTYGFDDTDLEVEVPTKLTHSPVVAFALAIGGSICGADDEDRLFSDGIITSNCVTVERQDDQEADLAFWYMFVGKRYATS